jgi:hypothetical protein
VSEINRVLKPGGYVEFRDIDPAIKNPGPTANKFFSNCKYSLPVFFHSIQFISTHFFSIKVTSRMSQLHSVDVTWTQHMCEVLSTQGDFTHIHHQEMSVGFGYQGPLATSIDCSIRDALKSYKQFFMEAYDMSSEVCDEKINAIIEESSEHHSFFDYYMAWGRKPLILEQLMNGQESPLIPLTPSTADTFDVTALNTIIPCKSPAELLENFMSENAYDIVHFANGFTE